MLLLLPELVLLHVLEPQLLPLLPTLQLLHLLPLFLLQVPPFPLLTLLKMHHLSLLPLLMFMDHLPLLMTLPVVQPGFLLLVVQQLVLVKTLRLLMLLRCHVLPLLCLLLQKVVLVPFMLLAEVVELRIHLCPPSLRCVFPAMLCLIEVGRMLIQLLDVLVLPHARHTRCGDVLVVTPMVHPTFMMTTETRSA